MCAANEDFFHCSAYKLLISDIKCAKSTRKCGLQEDLDPDADWYLSIDKIPTSTGVVSLESLKKPCLKLELKLVWLQGKVVRVEETGSGSNSLVIVDEEMEENEAIISEYNTVPGGDHPDIKIGAYIGALGQIWRNEPEVNVKPAKIMYLGDKPLYSSMWKDEVSLAKAFLAGLIEPTVL